MTRFGRPSKYGMERPLIVQKQNIVNDMIVKEEMKEPILSGIYSTEDIKVSVFLAGRRQHLWENLYNSLTKNNDVNFEFIISGPVYPKFELPKNFKFLYSSTKPFQSVQLSRLHCQGETIVHIADDCRFSPHYLDILYERYKEQDNYKAVTMPNFWDIRGSSHKTDEEVTNMMNSIDMNTNNFLKLIPNEPNAPMAHVGGLMSNKFASEIGSFDNRYVIRFADLDFQMRAFYMGAKTIYCKEAWLMEIEDISKDATPGGYDDWNLFLRMWFNNSIQTLNNLFKVRPDEVHSYIDDGTLHCTNQGTKDTWD